MEGMLNLMRQEAQRVDALVAKARFGTVTSYDPDTHAVKVRLEPEGYETGWAKLGTTSAGNGFGVFGPPQPGDQVWVDFESGDVASPVVLAAFYSDEDRPVVEGVGGCPAGEKWIVHASGARLRFLNDGAVEIRQQEGTQVKLNPDGSVDINAPVLRVGEAGAAFLRLLDERFHAWAATHTHPSTGPAIGCPPLPACATQNLRGA